MNWNIHHLVDNLSWRCRDRRFHWHRDCLGVSDGVVVRPQVSGIRVSWPLLGLNLEPSHTRFSRFGQCPHQLIPALQAAYKSPAD